MQSNFQRVYEFNDYMGKARPLGWFRDNHSQFLTSVDCENAMRLVREEVGELETAITKKCPREFADAIADSVVVLYGTAAVAGLDMDPIFNNVMDSNMTKFPSDKNSYHPEVAKVITRYAQVGSGRYAAFDKNNKLMKPSTYKEPWFKI